MIESSGYGTQTQLEKRRSERPDNQKLIKA